MMAVDEEAMEGAAEEAEAPAPAAPPERFDLVEIMVTVQDHALKLQAMEEALILAGIQQPSEERQREIRKWKAAAQVVEFASYDETSFREFCRRVANGQFRKRFLEFVRRFDERASQPFGGQQ